MFVFIPANSRELHRYLITRFFIAGTVICVVIGGLVYYWEGRRVEKMAFELAVVSAKHFDTPEMRALLSTDKPLSHPELAAILEQSGFIGVRIFDLSGNVLMETLDRSAVNIWADVGTHQHAFPEPGNTHSNWLENNDGDYVQVVIPLLDFKGTVVAYFEGIYRPDAGTQYARKTQVRSAVFTAFVVAISSLLLLYPVLLGLTRRALALSSSLLDSNLELLQSLGSAIAKRDSDTDTHNYRVTLYAVKLAEAMKLNRIQIESVIVGAFLHDVGKIGIPDQILLKPGRLTAEEFEIMKTHVLLGSEIIHDSNWLKQARDVVLFHHERFDGHGYPHGLCGMEIPVCARLFAVVDVFDALMSERPYKGSLLFEEALKILREGAGNHFDPEVVDIFEKIAPALYDDIGCGDKQAMREKMKSVVKKYIG